MSHDRFVWSDLAARRVTAGSRIPGTRRIPKDTGGQEGEAIRGQEGTRGHGRILQDPASRRFGTVRPRVQIPGPRPKPEFKSVPERQLCPPLFRRM